MSNSFSGSCIYRIRHSGCDGWYAHLTDPGGTLVAGDDIYFDPRHFVHAQDGKIVEVALLDAPVLERCLCFERGGETEHDATLHLRGDVVRIHHFSAIDCTDHAVHPDISI